MKTLPKLLVFLIVLFLFIIYHLSFIIAADAIPQPGKIPCDPNLKADPEYNSLRPYQASPCGDIPLSLFCGNTLILFLDNVKTIYCGQEWCPYIGPNPITKKVVVDLKDVELPILGNTELVKNSQNSEDKLDDATKVNEYVSWYLNGVVNRAEYSEGKNTDTELVNFSGPINKLLPGVIQEAQRIETIKSATEQEVTTEDDGTQTEQAQNHNQIVVCERLGKPVECYDGNGSKSNGAELRLNDWNEGNLSTINWVLNNWFGTEKWNSKIPPLPWQFEKEIYYQKAYNEWRGKTCAIVFDKLVCVELGIVPNKWADLYPYIPLANTVDKKGKKWKTAVHVTAPKAKILDSRYDDIPSFPPNFPLYFAHTKEDFQLAELLKKTYIPQEHASGSADSNTLKDFETTDPGQCQVVDVRSNPGDDVTFDNPESNMGASIEYTVGDIKCELTKKYGCIEEDPNTGECLVQGWIEDWKCESDVYAEIPLELQYPYIDKVWESTTVGADSIFRRIFPKTGKDAPVSCIADIPGESKANYSLDEGNSSPGVELLKVKDPGGNASDNPKLYFPHLGTVYEYFLKGIQTALRPKGYGEPITNGTECTPLEEEKKCDVNVPDSAVDSKYLGSFKSNFIDLANKWTSDCSGPENNLAEECYNYVASESKKAGVNPAFALTIWLNESGASNYCHGGETTQDFGINLSNIYQNIVEQLKAFLNMAKMKLCEGVDGFVEPMHGWLSRFQSSAGVCDPSDQTATDYYYEVMGTTWTYLTNCVKNGLFGITWPTDMSCP